jgi:signal transduction histidine kinase
MQSRQLARQPRFSWIKPDESVFFLDRKHVFFLFRSLILPIFFLVASIPMITIGVADLPAALIIGVGMLLFSLFGLVWNWLDWSNDFYIVTNQRLVWIEKILLLYDSRDEAPLYNVLAVDIYTTWLGNRLDYGDVTARTYTGQIPMRCASQPYLLGSYIEGLRKRSEQIFRELEDEQMQLAIAESIRKRQQPSLEDLIPNIPSPMPYKALKKKVSEEKKPVGFRARMQNFLKVRYEQDGVITYRKSWPILVWKIWLPVIFFIFWMFGFMTLLTQPGADGVSMAWFSIMALLFLGLVFWLWYNYTDWKNDIYRLTPTQIFDIEKKPLGSEIKKSADLDNILTITHSRQFLGVLLNYGDVIITVGDTQFIFLSVYNPDRVHQDIANYQENLRQRKKKVQEAREKERMLNWLTAYDIESNKMN